MDRKNIIVKAFLIIEVLFLVSCREDNKVSVAPATCDTSNVAFATVQPIFEAGCTSCHSQLSNEADSKEWADFPRLMGSLRHEVGYMAMPQGTAKLSDCEINKIQAWYNKVK